MALVGSSEVKDSKTSEGEIVTSLRVESGAVKEAREGNWKVLRVKTE